MTEVRNIGYLSWKDPFAWMESMKGKRWTSMLAHEKHNYNTLAKQVEKEARHIEQEITDVYQYLDLPPFLIGNIQVTITETNRYKWGFTSKKQILVDDLDVANNHVWYAMEDDNDVNKNKVVCVNGDGKIQWSRKEVSSQIAVIDNICYYIMVTDYYNTIELRACNAYTGRNERILYKEPNKECDLTLWKTSGHTLYLQSSDPSQSQLFHITDHNVVPLYKSSKFQIPLGKDAVLTRQRVDAPWVAQGKSISSWILPKQEIEHAVLHSGHIVTIYEGAHTIWFCSPHKEPVRIFSIKAGDIIPLPWASWLEIDSYIIKSPFSIPQVMNIIDNTPVFVEPLPIERPVRFRPLEVHHAYTTSKDGTSVPYIFIKEKGTKPKALLVYVYGAYGSSSAIEWPYRTWYPLLQRDWAIVYALVRGGGDVDMKWANQGRRDNRHQSVDDYEAVIRAAQHITKINAEHTVIYGRSAGGVPVGSIITRYPDGNLVGAAYTEVPYVDMLRDTTNPKLPLTVGEYKEFGNPRASLLHFDELLHVSPINALPADGASMFVLTRVGLLDRQVYAYESFKWIQHLRGSTSTIITDPKGKYVIYDNHEAHVYGRKKYIPAHAMDLAILDAWAKKQLRISGD